MTLQKNSCIFNLVHKITIKYKTKCHKTYVHNVMYLCTWQSITNITAVYNILEVCKSRVASYKHLHLGFLSGSYMYMMPYAVMREKPNKLFTTITA